MMRRKAISRFVLFLSVLGCSSCHSPSGKEGGTEKKEETSLKKEEKTAQDTISPVRQVLYKPDSTAKYMGAYSGSFGDGGIITLVLNYISGRTVSGYDVHKGLRRNINGEVARDGGKLYFVLKEPGDNRFDGTFSFTLDTASRTIEGEWIWDNPTRVVARHQNILLTPVQWDENDANNEWKHADTTLSFRNGSCQLVISPTESDYSSQKVVVRGNYNRNGDSFRVEWEKNPYISESVMMVKYRKRVLNEYGDSTSLPFLHGGGMEFKMSGEPDK